MKATIRLFKSLVVDTPFKEGIASKHLLRKTISRGFIYSPEVVSQYSEEELIEYAKFIGLDKNQINSSFHKSWNKIATADIKQLVVEQMLHYLTTYGFQDLGIYNKDYVYIPNEKLDVPDFDYSPSLVVIKGITLNTLKFKVMSLLGLGVALQSETIHDFIQILERTGIDSSDLLLVKNKEVNSILCDKFNIFPESPVELLRYILYKCTGNTLLIKSRKVITEIIDSDKTDVGKIFDRGGEDMQRKLASIFYRFKPIFLALKTSESLRWYVNKLNRLAVKYHQPMPEDFLNTITSKCKRGDNISINKLDDELDKANIWRKIRLANALSFRSLPATDSIMYKIRNGKSWSTSFKPERVGYNKQILGVILESISKSLAPNFKGKKVYIPKDVSYALPSSEKQFVGNIPCGSYVTVDSDLIFGIHWNNLKGRTIDLDLSMSSAMQGKIGWDGSYRNNGSSILFSGDITDARGPNGASELFYVKKQQEDALIVMLNYFNYNEDYPVPFDIIVGKEKMSGLKKNYMLDPNNIIASVKTEMPDKQKIVGLVTTNKDENRYYFIDSTQGNTITSGGQEHLEQARKFLFTALESNITLKEVLEKLDVEIVDSKDDCDIDLSIESLEKDTILNLLKEKV